MPSVYEIVAERIITRLAEGVVPWHHPGAHRGSPSPKGGRLDSRQCGRGGRVHRAGVGGLVYTGGFREGTRLGVVTLKKRLPCHVLPSTPAFRPSIRDPRSRSRAFEATRRPARLRSR